MSTPPVPPAVTPRDRLIEAVRGILVSTTPEETPRLAGHLSLSHTTIAEMMAAHLPVGALQGATLTMLFEATYSRRPLLARTDLPASVEDELLAQARRTLNARSGDFEAMLGDLARSGHLGVDRARILLRTWAKVGEPRRGTLRATLPLMPDLPEDLYRLLAEEAVVERMGAPKWRGQSRVIEPEPQPGIAQLVSHHWATVADWERWRDGLLPEPAPTPGRVSYEPLAEGPSIFWGAVAAHPDLGQRPGWPGRALTEVLRLNPAMLPRGLELLERPDISPQAWPRETVVDLLNWMLGVESSFAPVPRTPQLSDDLASRLLTLPLGVLELVPRETWAQWMTVPSRTVRLIVQRALARRGVVAAPAPAAAVMRSVERLAERRLGR